MRIPMLSKPIVKKKQKNSSNLKSKLCYKTLGFLNFFIIRFINQYNYDSLCNHFIYVYNYYFKILIKLNNNNLYISNKVYLNM